MNNAPDYENNLAFELKDTNFDTLKEYEAHGEPLPSYEEWKAPHNCMLENEVLRLANAKQREYLKQAYDLLFDNGWRFENVEKVKELLVNISSIIDAQEGK